MIRLGERNKILEKQNADLRAQIRGLHEQIRNMHQSALAVEILAKLIEKLPISASVKAIMETIDGIEGQQEDK